MSPTFEYQSDSLKKCTAATVISASLRSWARYDLMRSSTFASVHWLYPYKRSLRLYAMDEFVLQSISTSYLIREARRVIHNVVSDFVRVVDVLIRPWRRQPNGGCNTIFY